MLDIHWYRYAPPCMPRLLPKWNKGRPALSGGRSTRVKGQARLVEQSYLGPQERGMEPIRVQRTAAAPQGARPTLHTVQPRECGAAALFSPGAQELGRLALIKADIPPAPPGRRTSLSVGPALLLAALQRAPWPTSKRAVAEWYQGTVRARVGPAAAEALSRQRFWDHRDGVAEVHCAPRHAAPGQGARRPRPLPGPLQGPCRLPGGPAGGRGPSALPGGREGVSAPGPARWAAGQGVRPAPGEAGGHRGKTPGALSPQLVSPAGAHAGDAPAPSGPDTPHPPRAPPGGRGAPPAPHSAGPQT